MDQPRRAAESPYGVLVKSGSTYFWCACGLSSTQPFCDGSHQGTGFSPVRYQATKDDKLFFCGCKATATQPLCDGSHNRK